MTKLCYQVDSANQTDVFNVIKTWQAPLLLISTEQSYISQWASSRAAFVCVVSAKDHGFQFLECRKDRRRVWLTFCTRSVRPCTHRRAWDTQFQAKQRRLHRSCATSPSFIAIAHGTLELCLHWVPSTHGCIIVLENMLNFAVHVQVPWEANQTHPESVEKHPRGSPCLAASKRRADVRVPKLGACGVEYRQRHLDGTQTAPRAHLRRKQLSRNSAQDPHSPRLF